MRAGVVRQDLLQDAEGLPLIGRRMATCEGETFDLPSRIPTCTLVHSPFYSDSGTFKVHNLDQLYGVKGKKFN